MFTARHFIQTAKIISQAASVEQREDEAARWAEFFKEDNPRFDEGRFYKACGLVAPN